MTGGYFDPTVLGALEAAGYDRPFRQLGGPAPVAGAAHAAGGPTPGANDIGLDPAELTVTLPRGVRLDLGGVSRLTGRDRTPAGADRRGRAVP